MDKVTKRLLKENPELEFLKDKGIVKCKLSGHEMPCRVDVIESFVKGKKFKRLKDSQQAGKLPEHLSASVINKGKLFCALTNCYINCSTSNIERHTTGRRYHRALQKFQQGNLQLYTEQVGDEGDNNDQQTDDIDNDEVVDDQSDNEDSTIDDQDHVTDDHDEFVDQSKELEELIQATASASKRKRKHNNLTAKNANKDKSKKARIS